MRKNSLKKIRESLMVSKTELARKADISPVTIARVENGMPCRMRTKRKIILALGLEISDKNRVFGKVMESFVKNNEDRRLGMDRREFTYHTHIPDIRSGKERRNALAI